MSWWNIIAPADKCVFALDYLSPVRGSDVTFTNETSITASVYPRTSFKAVSSRTSGYDISSLLKEQKIVKNYASLNIRDVHLRLNSSIDLPTEFTMILKTKVHDSTVFMSDNGSKHGLAYGTSGQLDSDFKWRFQGYTSELDSSIYDKELLRNSVHTVVLKGNLNTKEILLITDLGTDVVPSTAFSSANFLNSSRYFNILGYSYTSASWRPTADLIGYGLFSYVMTEEELNTTLQTLDEETLISIEEDQSFKFKTSFGTPLESFDVPTEYHIEKNLFKVSKSQRPGINTNSNNKLKFKIIPMLYKKYEQISDYVYEEGNPVITKLFLYEKGTGQLIKVTSSDINGYFEFNYLDEASEYIVRASDKKYQFQSIIKDYNN